MRRSWVTISALLACATYLALRSGSRTGDLSAAGNGSEQRAQAHASPAGMTTQGSRTDGPIVSASLQTHDSDHVEVTLAHPAADGAAVAGGLPGAGPSPQVSAAPAVLPLHPRKGMEEAGPSIGSIKVLGHRGCDLNTPGWFLSVGSPEQYDFTISDDGESVFVEPNVPNPTGQFELVHCVDPEELLGKRVRFTARVKGENITELAQLRLRGENDRKEKIVSEVTKLPVTFDWPDAVVEAQVDPEVTQFSYGFTFKTHGRFWISHPRFGLAP